VGSIDQLMILNEQSQKIDLTLENTCKKFEKVALETGGVTLKELPFMNGNDKMSYRDYIKGFTW